MKGLERIILIAVFVVPIVICVLILKSIWAEEPAPIEDETENKVSVSIGDEVIHPDDILFSGEGENIIVGDVNGSGSGSSSEIGSNKLEQISKLYTDAEIKAVLADVYTTTDVTSERIGTMEKYTKVTAQKFSGGWSQVTGIDSKGINISGWVKTDNITFPDDDAPSPSELAAYTLLREQLDEIIETLTPREAKVLRLRFGLDDGKARTLEEVGKEFQVTRERIRQIEAKALRKLRHPSRSKKLKDFMSSDI